VIAALLTAGALVYAAYIQRSSSNGASATATTVSAPASGVAEDAVQVTIDPHEDPVPRCVMVKGTVTPSAQVTVWLAVRAPDDKSYFGTVTETERDPARPNGWRKSMELGRESEARHPFEVYAFALGDQATRALRNIRASTDTPNVETYWYLAQLPTKAIKAVYTRNSGRDEGDVADC
jgi:hypothetical protein